MSAKKPDQGRARRSGRGGLWALLLSALLVSMSAVASAQEGGEAAKKSDIPDKPKALQEQDKVKEELSKGPSATREDLEVSARDPQEVKKLQERIRSLNQSQIDKIERILSKDPTHARKADMLFQKAELLYEVRNYDGLLSRAEWLKCVEAADQGSVDAASCKEPTADYSDALNVYKQVLQEFPGYERLDEVIFRLGDGLMKAEKKKEGISFLTRLVQNYPQSKYLPDAHLSIAEFWFEQNLLTPARLSYEEVLKFKGTALYNYAQYKLAWVLYNQKEYREAVNTFKTVVEEVEKDKSQAKLSFANQALNDLVVSWVEIDGGWKEAKDYFLKKRDKDFAHKKLRQMAGVYDTTGKNEPRIEIYEYLLGDNPLDPKAPDYWEAIIDARKKVGVREEWEGAVRTMIGYFDPKGKWWGANASDSKVTANGRLLAEGYLAQIASEYHQRAQKAEDKELYRQASKDYALFLEKFPDSKDAYDMRFFYAQILHFELEEWEKAAEQYKLVSREKADGEHVENALDGRIQTYQQLVLKSHPTSALVRLAGKSDGGGQQRLEAVEVGKEDLKESAKKERTELFQWEVPFIEASDDWATKYPKKEETPTINFVSAQVLHEHGQYDKAVPRYEAIIQNAPQHRYASYAGNALLECHNELKNWSELEKWGRYLLDNKIFDVTPKDKLQSAIAYAINQRSKELTEEKRYTEAAEQLIRLANEWPDSDLAPGALFNAASIYTRDEQLKKATEYYEKLIKEYPKHELAPEAMFVMGEIFEARTDFDTAASYFARLGDNKDWREKFEKSGDAVYNAAYIQESLEKWGEAIKTYEKYIKLFPQSEAVPQVAFHLGELYERAGDKKNAAKAYQDFLKKYKDKPRLRIEAQLSLGKLTEEAGGKNAEKDAEKYYAAAIADWGKMTDEGEKKLAREAASEALFLKGEQVYRKFTSSPLQDPNKLAKELTTKGELLAGAETIYFDVVDKRSPFWTAAAAYRIGQMYKEFSDALYNYPLPPDLPEEYVDEYRAQIDEFSFPLQEKALKAFQRALALALELGAFNEWSEKSALEMSKLEAETYPLTKQPGVETVHRAQLYLSSKPLGSEDVSKRADERLKADEMKKPAPPAPGAGQQ
jgi:TolA-binding protein